MPKAKTSSSGSSKKMRPALTPEARENQMISLAVDLAEQQLRDGTASSQVITHFLKLGTTRDFSTWNAGFNVKGNFDGEINEFVVYRGALSKNDIEKLIYFLGI